MFNLLWQTVKTKDFIPLLMFVVLNSYFSFLKSVIFHIVSFKLVNTFRKQLCKYFQYIKSSVWSLRPQDWLSYFSVKSFNSIKDTVSSLFSRIYCRPKLIVLNAVFPSINSCFMLKPLVYFQTKQWGLLICLGWIMGRTAGIKSRAGKRSNELYL